MTDKSTTFIGALNGEQDSARLSRLREKAMTLPLSPGVYLMKDKNDKIIYVGKSRVLRQRVSQYFAEGQNHTLKTRKMVASVRDFDYILTKSEIEALSLENRLIKLHMPRYNIKLKDGKSYPYIRVSVNDPYPEVTVTRRRLNDGAKYFGPYSGISDAYTLLNTVRKCFGVASCGKSFPRDIGKSRPCLNYQIGLCCCPCTGKVSEEEYRDIFRDVLTFLGGKFGEVKRSLTERMEYAAENLMFESAALYRNRLQALNKLWDQQIVVGKPGSECDVIAFVSDPGNLCACLTVLYIRDGFVADKEHFIFGADTITDEECVISCLYQLYSAREYIPKEILLDFSLGQPSEKAVDPAEKATAESADEGTSAEMATLAEYLRQRKIEEQGGGNVKLRVPVRGDAKALCKIARENAEQYLSEYKTDTEKRSDTLIKLASMLALEVVPERIEAYDISNYGAEHITAGMVVMENGKLKKSDYRTYRIRESNGQDDYASMCEVIRRRVTHATAGTLPDLILLDGGKGHVSSVKEELYKCGVSLPVFGMVKDEYHKTRALTTESEEINIAREQAVFMMIYKLQEEVHRFTVGSMTGAKRKEMKSSSLEKISGIGPSKAKALLSHFKTYTAVKNASFEELCNVKGLSEGNAKAVYAHFHENGE